MTRFEVGKRYTHGWIGDSELFTTWEVVKRTACTVTITRGNTTKTCRIRKDLSELENCECISPFGLYSMSPTLRATGVEA